MTRGEMEVFLSTQITEPCEGMYIVIAALPMLFFLFEKSCFQDPNFQVGNTQSNLFDLVIYMKEQLCKPPGFTDATWLSKFKPRLFLNDLDFVKSAEGFPIKLHILVKAKVILKYIFVPFDSVHYLCNIMCGRIFDRMVVC